MPASRRKDRQKLFRRDVARLLFEVSERLPRQAGSRYHRRYYSRSGLLLQLAQALDPKPADCFEILVVVRHGFVPGEVARLAVRCCLRLVGALTFVGHATE